MCFKTSHTGTDARSCWNKSKRSGGGRGGGNTSSWHLHQWKCIPTEGDSASKLPVWVHSIKWCQPQAQHWHSRKICRILMSLSIPCLHSHQPQHKFETFFPFQQQLSFSSLSGPFFSNSGKSGPCGAEPCAPFPRAGQKEWLIWAWKTSIRSVKNLLQALSLEKALWRLAHLRSCVMQHTKQRGSDAAFLQEQEIPLQYKCINSCTFSPAGFLQKNPNNNNKKNPKPPPSSVTPLPNTNLLKTYLLHHITPAVLVAFWKTIIKRIWAQLLLHSLAMYGRTGVKIPTSVFWLPAASFQILKVRKPQLNQCVATLALQSTELKQN